MSRWRTPTVPPRPGDMPKAIVAGRCECCVEQDDKTFKQCSQSATVGRMCKTHAAQYAATWGKAL